MKSSVVNKKVTNISVELDYYDLDFIITEHFKRLYDMTTSEVTVDLNEIESLMGGCVIHVNCNREELC